MGAISGTLLSATVTFLAVLFYFYTGFTVGRLRGQHGIKAPATSGHPLFDRAYRVQLNTLEQLGIFLPFLWLATLYPVAYSWIAPAIGLIWVAGRVVYMRLYMADPETRLPGAAISGLTNLALVVLSLIGLADAWRAAL